MRRRELARIFRDLRLQHRYPLEHVAAAIGASVSKVSRMESGLRGIAEDDVRKLSELYQLPPLQRGSLLQIAKESRGRSWWQSADIPRQLQTYIGIEQAATAINSFSSAIVPGVFQTADYATALIEGSDLDSAAELRSAAVATRLRRQEILTAANPPWVRAVLDEAVLHRAVGGPSTMRAQLERLAEIAERPRVVVQVIPFSAGAHPGLGNSFVILSIGEHQVPETVHLEGLSGYAHIDDPAEHARFGQAWHQLSAVAMPPRDSIELIARIARSGPG